MNQRDQLIKTQVERARDVIRRPLPFVEPQKLIA